MSQQPRKEALRQAIAEAKRFIMRAQEAVADDSPDFYPSQRRAAARRASLDLTVALARYRNARA